MGARLTFGLVALAAVTLALGFFSHTAWIIYISIVCSVIAAAGLLLAPWRKRPRPTDDKDTSWPASLAEPPIEPTAPVRLVAAGPTTRPAARGGEASPRRRQASPVDAVDTVDAVEAVDEPDVGDEAFEFPRPVVGRSGRRRPVAPAAAAEDDLDGEVDEPRVIRLPSSSRPPKKNPVVADWVAGAPTVAQPAASSFSRAPAVPAPRRASSGVRPATAAPPPPRRPAPSRPGADYPFPIEDYDYLGVAEILPLLPELDDTELVEVLLYEQKGANRVGILNRIDALLEGEG